MSRLSRFDSIWALEPSPIRTSRRLDVSIVSIQLDLGPLAAWGPPDVSMSRLSRFGWIWGLEARWYRYIWYMAYDISIPILPVRSSNLDEAVSVRGLG